MHCEIFFVRVGILVRLFVVLLFSSSAAVRPAASSTTLSSAFCMVVMVVIDLSVASPGRRHSSRGYIGSIVNESEKLIFIHCLTEFPQHVIVYVSCVTTGFEEGSRMGEPSGTVVSWKQVGTNRQQDCESVRIRVHFRLVSKPVKYAKGDL
jgi:hypothetical protein